ncbi:hypothetical protein JCM10213_000136 [Rhodosporidiobolus nylandii]
MHRGDWHYESAIPFPFSGSVRRTSFSPPLHLSHSPSAPPYIQEYPSPSASPSQPDLPPHLSPRPERPDVPLTPQPDEGTPVLASRAGEEAFAPSASYSGAPASSGLLPSLATSPPRPRRPSNPEQAYPFHSPLPLPPSLARSYKDIGASAVFPAPPTSSLPLRPGAAPGSSRPFSTSYRKPVPALLPPHPAPSSPLHFLRSTSPTRSYTPQPSSSGHGGETLHANSPGRLSISGFEALLQRMRAQEREGGVEREVDVRTPVQRLQEEEADETVVWSPRIHLGLDETAVSAREERLRRDREASAPVVRERDLGERGGLFTRVEIAPGQAQPETQRQKRAAFAAAPPAVAMFTSPSGGIGFSSPPPRSPPRASTSSAAAAGPQTPPRETGSIKRFLTPRSARSKRSRVTSYDPSYVEEEELEVEETRDGPLLRRGSKRLSDLPSADEGSDEEKEKEQSASATGSGGERSRRSAVVLKTKRTSPTASRRTQKVEVIVHSAGETTSASEGEEVVPPGAPGDWERVRSETLCRPERMNWKMVDFEGWFPRVVHLFYPPLLLLPIVATLFLDYNLLYLLCQLALYPSLPSSETRNIATRALVDVPYIRASTGWWVAVGVYAACTAAWSGGVVLWKEVGREYYGRWGSGGKNVAIEKVYAGSASFNLACCRSFSVFSFLWRVRLAPFFPKSALALAVDGTTWTDGVKETLDWYRQNWPTVLLLIPRGGLSVAVLLLYSTTAYSSSASTISRDSAYFATEGTLSAFASGVLFANAAWAAWRLILLIGSAAGLWLIDCRSLIPFRSKRAYSEHHYPSRERLATSSPLPFLDEKAAPFSSSPSLAPLPRRASSSNVPATWRTRRQRRLRAAILACLGSTPITQTSSAFPSPFAKSPYMSGLSPSSTTKSTFAPRKSTDEDRRRTNLDLSSVPSPAPHSAIVVHADESPMMASAPPAGGLWRSASHYLRPAPKVKASPLISFSPATPEVPGGRFSGPPPALAETTGAQPRRRESLAPPSSAGGQEADLGESRLHRRVRSLPVNNDGEEGEQPQQHPAIRSFERLSPSSLPYRSLPSTATGRPPPPLVLPSKLSSNLLSRPELFQLHGTSSHGPSDASASTHEVGHTLDAPPSRPHLSSHFSAFSSRPPSSGQPSPALEPPTRTLLAIPRMSRASATSSFASPMPASLVDPRPSSARAPSPSPTATPQDFDPFPSTSSAAATQRQSDRPSARLLDEVRRLQLAEGAAVKEDKREAGLKRISEATYRTSAAFSADEYETARTSSSHGQPGVDDEEAGEEESEPRRFSEQSLWSQPDSVGGLSESSTLRGAVRTPRTPSFADALDRDRPLPPPPAREGEPFRLSYSSTADRLSLSAWGSPAVEQEGDEETETVAGERRRE